MCVKFRVLLPCVLACVFCAPVFVSAQELRDVVVFALENHPAVEGAQLGYKAAMHEKSAERSRYYPEISTRVTAGRVYQDNATSRGLDVTRGAAYSGLAEGSIALRQTLFDGLERRNRVDAADARMKSLDYALLDVEGTLTYRIAQSYIDILRLRSALRLLEAQAAQIIDYDRRIGEMVEEGVADEAELQQSKDVAMIIEGVRVDYEGQLAAAEAIYMEASGQAVPESTHIPRSLQIFIDSDIEAALRVAKEKHPVLQSAEMDSEATRHQVEVEEARLYPDIDGELSYLKADKRDVIGGESVDGRAVIHMNWNFSTGGGGLSSVRQKRYEHSEALAHSEALEGEIERDVYQAYAHYNTFKRKLSLSEDRVALNEKLLEAYKAQFEGARISLLSLMRAESQLFNARLEESDNKYYLLSSEYALLSSLGRLKDILMLETDHIVDETYGLSEE